MNNLANTTSEIIEMSDALRDLLDCEVILIGGGEVVGTGI